jgi:hypothetical protein
MTRAELAKLQETIRSQLRERREAKRKEPDYNPLNIWVEMGDARSYDEIVAGLDPELRARGVEVIGWSTKPAPYPTFNDTFRSDVPPRTDLGQGEVRATEEQIKERERIDTEADKLRTERAARPKGFDQKFLDYERALGIPPGGRRVH